MDSIFILAPPPEIAQKLGYQPLASIPGPTVGRRSNSSAIPNITIQYPALPAYNTPQQMASPLYIAPPPNVPPTPSPAPTDLIEKPKEFEFPSLDPVNEDGVLLYPTIFTWIMANSTNPARSLYKIKIHETIDAFKKAGYKDQSNRQSKA